MDTLLFINSFICPNCNYSPGIIKLEDTRCKCNSCFVEDFTFNNNKLLLQEINDISNYL